MMKHIRYGAKKFYAALTLLSVEIILLLIVFIAALISFVAIAKMVFADKQETFDNNVFYFLSTHVSNANTSLMQFFTFLGTHLFLIPANLLLVAFFLFIKKRRWYSITIPVVALSSLLLMFLLKYIFHRSRPLTPLLQEAQGFSFPSGHALMSTTFYGLIIFLIWQQVKNKFLKWVLMAVLFLLIIIIGISRVYLKVHYASDVLAGFCVGFGWLLLSIWVLNKIEKYSSRKVDPLVQKENVNAA